MFKELIENIAQGSHLGPALQAIAQHWNSLPESARTAAGGLDQFALAAWSDRTSDAFPWHTAAKLSPVEDAYATHVIYQAPDDAARRTWPLIGYNALTRHRLTTNLQSLESFPEGDRDDDLKIAHREIVTAFRIEELALRRQSEQVQEFLAGCGCRVVDVRGVDDMIAELRQRPFKAHAAEDCRQRLNALISVFFTAIPRIVAHPANDPAVALRETESSHLLVYDPNGTPCFGLEPVLKAECELYLSAGVIEREVQELHLTISSVIDVLDQAFKNREQRACVSA